MNRLRIACAIVLSTVMFPPNVLGTTVVALLDTKNRRITIAADCLVTKHGVGAISGSSIECKILVKPDCVVAISGLYTHRPVQYDLRKIVAQACDSNGDLLAKADFFSRTAGVPFQTAMLWYLKNDPTYFTRELAQKSTEVIFAGVVKGKLTLIAIGLIANEAGVVRIERYVESTGYFMGLNDHILEYLNTNPKANKTADLTLARQLVELEMKNHPTLAGPPVSEVVLDEKGSVHWISRGACVKKEPALSGSR
jgi:hypothetical protein